jgi:hypothetical protein
MPSWWERMTGVAPKTATDSKYLAFLAARYRGEQRLPRPGALVAPDELRRQQWATFGGRWTCAGAITLVIIGLAAQQLVLAVTGGVVLCGAVVVMVRVSVATAPAINEFNVLKSRCEAAHSRLPANPMDPTYRSTLNEMIDCDEGTLAYCAAKIASEIEQDPAWKSERLEVIVIDLWDEVAEIGRSARQIAKDREVTERLERGRLRDGPEVQEMIDADKQLRSEAVALLAARVYAFTDYRDRVHRLGMAAVRESNTMSRAMRLAADEQAIDRLR